MVKIGREEFLVDDVFDRIDENLFHISDDLVHNDVVGLPMVVDFYNNGDQMNEKDSENVVNMND
jgi:hypothetical protein